MIETKYLEVEYGFTNYQEIDELINAFIQENQQIEVLDIKFQSNKSAVADSGVSAEYLHTSALIIYKTPPQNQTAISSKGMGFLIECDKCGKVSTIKTNHIGQTTCYKCKGEEK
ncbi:sporulation protein Cse60 [Streptococcus uberis]|uniref:Sporulation protein Cse60 n=1 Tax=Streptococcus uberis TaxID=1349 RepID=A0A6L6G946_STRUB|nr:sporulation protein Cse60 [Streptococcus uberis]MTB36482.1 sporulation protein Cse60 [Streptococcus uberis]MTB36575.1 sporulation protein Cse60 [Streptococcus uberis]MTB54064.1 sporulation protein Cse60 [Streptococcus uberis]MTB61327.1 sporulation protein Cse60 [Streptococcus uberis]MTC86008.1 sporulation protein Cse60 [Streptococcus uberis]